MPIIEIVKFTVSDAYVADPSIAKPALDYLVKVDGCLDVYTGVAEEDEKRFYLIVVWETLAHHRALQNTPGYPHIIGLQPAINDDGLKMNHVEFNNGFEHILSAPVTEILRVELKKDVEKATRESLDGALERGVPRLDAINPDRAPASWGWAVEDDKAVWLLCGWESQKVHRETIHANLTDLMPFIAALSELVERTEDHVKFTKHIAA